MILLFFTSNHKKKVKKIINFNISIKYMRINDIQYLTYF